MQRRKVYIRRGNMVVFGFGLLSLFSLGGWPAAQFGILELDDMAS